MWYSIDEQGKILLHFKSRDKVYTAVSDLEPYCFVRKIDEKAVKGFRIENTDLKDFKGNKLVKVIARRPDEIGALNRRLQAVKIPTYEADIPYVRRWMIDKDISIKTDMSKLYFDFETEAYPDKEIKYWKLKSVAMVDDAGKEFYIASSDEKEIIDYFVNMVKQYDMAIGWNSDMFDLVVLESAMKRNKMNYGELRKEMTFFDLLEGYKRDIAPTKKGIHNFSLDNIARMEIGDHGKLKVSREVKTKAFKDMSDEEKKLLRDYNLEDARLVKEIDEKTSESEIRIALASEGYVFVEDTFGITKLIDSILLRKFRLAGYVLPSGGNATKTKTYKGAYIKDSAKGIFHNVVVYDVTSLYPTVIMQYKISPEPERKVVPEFISEIFRRRKEEKKLYEQTKDKKHHYLQYALKILMNATYGYMGTPVSRIYDNLLASSITGYGRIVISKMIEYFEGKGLTVVFGDTDSCAVVLPEKDVKNVAEAHRQGVIAYLRSELGKDFDVKVDKIFKKLYLTGVKKRYVGITEKGDKEVTGFELIRGDWFDLAKEVEAKLFDYIFEYEDNEVIKQKAIELFENVKRDLYAGRYDDKLIFSINSFRREAKVKTRTIKALEELEKRGIKIQSGSSVKYFIAKGNKVVPVVDNKPVFDAKPDYDFYVKRLENLLVRVVGVEFERKRKSKKITQFFGLDR
jgi:DNA polymerase I